ncbi:MAG: ABC transporter substrate-binding protein [Pseudomonadota bacterium]
MRVQVPPSAPFSGLKNHLGNDFPENPERKRQGTLSFNNYGCRTTGGGTGVSVTFKPALAAALLLALPGCSLLSDDGPVRVAAIGAMHRNPDRVPPPLSLPDSLLLDAVGQGLVTLTAEGQIEAGLAERWTVLDDGLSYIFRLRETQWPGGQRVRAGDIAAMLRQRIASVRLRTALRGEFRDIVQIRAMTERVIEIQLRRPQADLLELLAHPDLTLSRNGQGWGPMAPHWNGNMVSLAERNSSAAEEEGATPETPAIAMWGSNSVNGVTQFDQGAADTVIGGRFEGWPMLAAADVASNSIVRDPVEGMFGLAVTSPRGILSGVEAREAIAMALDRVRMTRALDAPGWTPRITIRPASTNSQTLQPVYPAWVDLSATERRSKARAAVAAWRTHSGRPARPVVRIALPDGAGARILFAWLHSDLGAIGIDARRVPLSGNADLRLIDEVAPTSDPAWFIRRLDCGHDISCNGDASALVTAIDEAATPLDRANAISLAEEAILRHAAFIPIAAPLRWSLRGNRAASLHPNARGWHGLYRLQPTPD